MTPAGALVLARISANSGKFWLNTRRRSERARPLRAAIVIERTAPCP